MGPPQQNANFAPPVIPLSSAANSASDPGGAIRRQHHEQLRAAFAKCKFCAPGCFNPPSSIASCSALELSGFTPLPPVVTTAGNIAVHTVPSHGSSSVSSAGNFPFADMHPSTSTPSAGLSGQQQANVLADSSDTDTSLEPGTRRPSRWELRRECTEAKEAMLNERQLKDLTQQRLVEAEARNCSIGGGQEEHY